MTYVRQCIENELRRIIRCSGKQTLFLFSETFFPNFETFEKHNVLIRRKDIILRKIALNKDDHNVPAKG